jgi:hypothetical protein
MVAYYEKLKANREYMEREEGTKTFQTKVLSEEIVK